MDGIVVIEVVDFGFGPSPEPGYGNYHDPKPGGKEGSPSI
jgi:hypothetical protein